MQILVISLPEQIDTFLGIRTLNPTIRVLYGLVSGYESGLIKASEFRSYHTPLNKQV